MIWNEQSQGSKIVIKEIKIPGGVEVLNVLKSTFILISIFRKNKSFRAYFFK